MSRIGSSFGPLLVAEVDLRQRLARLDVLGIEREHRARTARLA